jgi:hypothetical protein
LRYLLTVAVYLCTTYRTVHKTFDEASDSMIWWQYSNFPSSCHLHVQFGLRACDVLFVCGLGWQASA